MKTKKFDYSSMFVRRKDGRWQGYYYDADGKRHCVSDSDPERLQQRLIEKEAASKKKPVITFRSVAESWERQHREEIEIRTWKNYAPHLADILAEYGDEPFEAVEPAAIVADLARAKARGLSATVVNARRSIWRMIFDHAVVTGVTRYNPVSSIKLPKGLKRGKRAAPTDEQMKVILRSLDAPFGLFAYLLLCTGLRKSEALALSWSDVDLKAKVIHVTKALDYTCGASPKYKSPKTAAGTRDVPIISILLTALQEAKKHSKSTLLFPCPASNRGGAGGGLMTDRGYDGAWTRYCTAVGLLDADGKPAITAHNLRHGTATLCFEFGVDELTTQAILGHSRVEITREIYTDLRKAQLAKSTKKLDRGMGKLINVSA